LLRCDEWEPNDSAIIHKRFATANLIDSPFTRAIAGLELDGEPAYMALECLSGEKLARRTAGNCLAPHDALSLGRQIAKAMIAAHRVGFVHGAIDPRIIQRRHDQLWTIDSVSSTIGAVEDDSSLAIKFHTAESRRGQAESACDIYGIALVLYWAMFGKNNRRGRESSVEASGIMNDVRSLPALQPAADGLTDLLVESLDQTAAIEVDPEVPQEKPLPDQLGRFRILGKLGEGGMGAVYEGEDLADGATVAIKVLNQGAAGNERSRRPFAKEARMLAKIQPGIGSGVEAVVEKSLVKNPDLSANRRIHRGGKVQRSGCGCIRIAIISTAAAERGALAWANGQRRDRNAAHGPARLCQPVIQYTGRRNGVRDHSNRSHGLRKLGRPAWRRGRENHRGRSDRDVRRLEFSRCGNHLDPARTTSTPG